MESILWIWFHWNLSGSKGQRAVFRNNRDRIKWALEIIYVILVEAMDELEQRLKIIQTSRESGWN